MCQPALALFGSSFLLYSQHRHDILHAEGFGQVAIGIGILRVLPTRHVFALGIVPRVLQHLAEEVVLKPDDAVVHQGGKLQVVVRDVQLARLLELVVLARQDAGHGEPCGIEHRTLSQVVQHQVVGGLCLLCRQLTEVVNVVCQSLQWQLARQLFELESPQLQRLVGFPVHHLLLDHREVGTIHLEDSHTTTQSIVDIPERELLVQTDAGARRY